MGSQHNSEAGSENGGSHKENSLALSSSTFFNDSTSYKGLKSEAMSQKMSQSGGSTVSDNQSEQEEQKFPVKFEWKEGGNDVYLREVSAIGNISFK